MGMRRGTRATAGTVEQGIGVRICAGGVRHAVDRWRSREAIAAIARYAGDPYAGRFSISLAFTGRHRRLPACWNREAFLLLVRSGSRDSRFPVTHACRADVPSELGARAGLGLSAADFGGDCSDGGCGRGPCRSQETVVWARIYAGRRDPGLHLFTDRPGPGEIARAVSAERRLRADPRGGFRGDAAA